MSKKDSGYERRERDLYETPETPTRALLPHIPAGVGRVWEPACATGKIVRVLQSAGYEVFGSDISKDWNFFQCGVNVIGDSTQLILTNPPYSHAQQFIEHALSLPVRVVIMLLPIEFDSAKTRKHLFKDNPHFAKKLVLLDRIKWFDFPQFCKTCNGTGQNTFFEPPMKCEPCKGKGFTKSGPSENHAWFIWDKQHSGPHLVDYA